MQQVDMLMDRLVCATKHDMLLGDIAKYIKATAAQSVTLD